ncbi:MAG: carbamoyl phosphate synthase large subunit, partial [Cyanobacteria bacterium J06626_14]
PDRILAVRQALKLGMTIEEVYELTNIDPWFLGKFQQLLETEKLLKRTPLNQLTADQLFHVKQQGFSDRQIAYATKTTEAEVRSYRKGLAIVPVYKTVDTCAAEFEALTPYYYSTYEQPVASVDSSEAAADSAVTSIAESEILPSEKRKVMILGGGPNRIGQGIEFDYCCCHASYALQDDGFETIMVNSNPETVSTD